MSETGKLTRYPYQAGDDSPKEKGQVIATFPDYGLSYKYGGWHLTRSLAFNKGKLYVSVGNGCNACVEKEEVRATVLEMRDKNAFYITDDLNGVLYLVSKK